MKKREEIKNTIRKTNMKPLEELMKKVNRKYSKIGQMTEHTRNLKGK